LGQIIPIEFSLKDKESIQTVVTRSNIVINCMGRFWSTRNYTLDQVHNTGPRTVAEISKAMGVEDFIHVSALGASKNSSSEFLKSKARGEESIREVYPNAIIIRPGMLIGHEEKFLNWHAQMHRSTGWNPIFFDGHAEMSPVYVGDIATAIQTICMDPAQYRGRTFELVGPRTYTQDQLLDCLRNASGLPLTTVTLNPLMSRLFGKICDYVPDHFLFGDMSTERVGLFERDNIPSGEAGVEPIKSLGITPLCVEYVTRSYLSMWRKGSPFEVEVSKSHKQLE
jgi:uncharacterized protein YbjT (DUF2867 family)